MSIDKAVYLYSSADSSTVEGAATLKLAAVSEIINQVVGDAMADLVLVEAILADTEMSLSDWDGQYTDLPNVLAKVQVCYLYTTTSEASRLLLPLYSSGWNVPPTTLKLTTLKPFQRLAACCCI